MITVELYEVSTTAFIGAVLVLELPRLGENIHIWGEPEYTVVKVVHKIDPNYPATVEVHIKRG